MAEDAEFFATRLALESDGWKLEGSVFASGSEQFVPLYEAKMIYLFNHRHGSYDLVPAGQRPHVLPDVPVERLADPSYTALPHYWVPRTEVEARLKDYWDHGWLLGWRDVTDARASARTVVATVMPRVGVGHTVPLLFSTAEPKELACLYANLCSFALDYVARQKVGGTHLTYFTLKQLPILSPEVHRRPAPWAPATTLASWIAPRVLELVYTASDLQPFARDLGNDGPPFCWDPGRRFHLRCELDAAFFHLYGIGREDVEYIMDTFPIVRDNDERAYGTYRTRHQIVEEYRQMKQSLP
jgi:hypothetical protein